MTVTTTLDRQYFDGDGSNKVFPFNFRFFTNDQIYVSLIAPDGTITPQSLTTNYTLAGALQAGGGTVTMIVAPPLTVPATRVFVQRILPQVQPTSIRNQGKFYPEIHEDAFDRLTMLIQQSLAGVDNSLQLTFGKTGWNFLGYKGINVGAPTQPTDAATKQYVDASSQGNNAYTDSQLLRTVRGGAGENLTQLPPPASRASKVLGFDSAGQPIAVLPASGSGTEVAIDLANVSDPYKGAGMVARSTVSVPSIASLLIQPMKEDLLYMVKSYYDGGTTGGGPWFWDPLSTEDAEYGSVLSVPGVTTGRFIKMRTSRDFSAYEYGVRASNTGTENRLRLLALGKKLKALSASTTVKMIDEDYLLCGASPVIFPGHLELKGGKGRIIPVFESVQPPATSATNPDGTFNCYGGMICFGDPITGKRFSGANPLDMGLIVVTGIRIKNANNLATTTSSFLHGISAYGGTNIYVDCQIDDMPNTGYYNVLPKAVYYYRSKGRRNGFLGPGFAKNGMSNIATHTVNFDYGENASTVLSVVECEFTGNKDEGIQYSSFPLTVIRDNDLRGNLDRAIENDNAYASSASTRPNDQAHIYNNDCRGVSGVTNYSMSFNDGYSKDVYLGGNILGNCQNIPLISTCTATGSFTFTARNTFYLDDVGLVNGCHAMYLNAGLIDLSVGGEILGSHSRSAFNTAMLNANNEIPLGGTVLIGNFTSGVTFNRAIEAKTSTKVRVLNVTCPTSRCFARVTLAGDTSLVEISNADGIMNTSGSAGDGILTFVGLATFKLDKLVLKGNLNDVNVATRYPIMVEGTAPAAGQINRLFSFGNYWKGYSFNGGAERLASIVGLAAKTSAADLPVLV